MVPMPKECRNAADVTAMGPSLTNAARALRDKKRINILAIGASAFSERDAMKRGYFGKIEQFIESTVKGLDVVIINRGVSGELARDAAERIKMEIAIGDIDLVLWQVGTADALAQMPIADFRTALVDTIGWLKAHSIDVMLIGLRYIRSTAQDEHYQALRRAIDTVAKDESVPRIGRYEAFETLAKMSQPQGELTDSELNDAASNCLAEHLGRVIATGIFAKDRPLPPAPSAPR